MGERGCWHWSRSSRRIYLLGAFIYGPGINALSICLHGYGVTGTDIGHICMDGVRITWDGAFEDRGQHNRIGLNIDTKDKDRSIRHRVWLTHH
jgi:hypothetical protein